MTFSRGKQRKGREREREEGVRDSLDARELRREREDGRDKARLLVREAVVLLLVERRCKTRIVCGRRRRAKVEGGEAGKGREGIGRALVEARGC